MHEIAKLVFLNFIGLLIVSVIIISMIFILDYFQQIPISSTSLFDNQEMKEVKEVDKVTTQNDNESNYQILVMQEEDNDDDDDFVSVTVLQKKQQTKEEEEKEKITETTNHSHHLFDRLETSYPTFQNQKYSRRQNQNPYQKSKHIPFSPRYLPPVKETSV